MSSIDDMFLNSSFWDWTLSLSFLPFSPETLVHELHYYRYYTQFNVKLSNSEFLSLFSQNNLICLINLCNRLFIVYIYIYIFLLFLYLQILIKVLLSQFSQSSVCYLITGSSGSEEPECQHILPPVAVV